MRSTRSRASGPLPTDPFAWLAECNPSEQKLQGKLDLPRSSHDRRNSAGIGVRGAAATEGAQRGVAEIGVVQDIEEFRAKLQRGRLGDPGILRQIDVQSRIAG